MRVISRPELIWTFLIGHCIKSSTASSVIGYNAQGCKHASVSGSAPTSERRFEFMIITSWWFDALHFFIMYDTTWLYQIQQMLIFFVFWKLLSNSTWLKNLRGHMPQWAWRLCLKAEETALHSHSDMISNFYFMTFYESLFVRVMQWHTSK